MNNDILTLGQAAEFLGISEKTMIKLLREEHVPARKIGREWRFSMEALIRWLAAGDSMQYINPDERYMVYQDTPCTISTLYSTMRNKIEDLEKSSGKLKALLPSLSQNISIPNETTLRVSYKQQRDVEKLEFKIFWGLRNEYKMEPNQKKLSIKKF